MAYKQAKYPKNQIKILAELNGTTDLAIERILANNGVFGESKEKKAKFVQTAEMQRLTRFKRMSVNELYALHQKHTECIRDIEKILEWKLENDLCGK